MRDAAEERHAPVGIGASHSEAATDKNSRRAGSRGG